MRSGHRHVSLDFAECENIEDLKTRAPIVRKILKLAREAGCTIRKWHFDKYKPEEGYTLVVTIAESHFAVLTWPEVRFANIDIFVCNYTRDNTNVAVGLEKALKKLFRPKKVKRWKRLRGPA